MKKYLSTTKLIQRIMVIAIFISFVIFVGEKRAEARELDDAACLAVCGEKMVDSPDVLKSVITDSQGGTAVYDLNKNTLTLTNFHGENKGSVIQAYGMGDDFAIILKGTNTLKTSYVCSINVPNGDICIKGNGTVNANAGIIALGDVKIQDCVFNVTSETYGVTGSSNTELTIDNAVLNIKITDQGNLHPLACGLDAKKITINSSNIYVSVPAADTLAPLYTCALIHLCLYILMSLYTCALIYLRFY